MKFLKLLLEKKEKEPEKKKIVFVETDPRESFPSDTVSALEKEINKNAKDLEKEWRSVIELVDFSFIELDVPKPLAYLDDRWEQYKRLISYAVIALRKSRGMKGRWTTSI